MLPGQDANLPCGEGALTLTAHFVVAAVFSEVEGTQEEKFDPSVAKQPGPSCLNKMWACFYYESKYNDTE